MTCFKNLLELHLSTEIPCHSFWCRRYLAHYQLRDGGGWMGQNGQVIRISLQKWPPIFPQQRVFLGGLSGNNCRVLGGSQSHWVVGSRWGREDDKDQFTKMVANSSAAPLCAPTLWSYPSLLPCRQRHPDRQSIVGATKLWSPIKTKSPTRPSVDQVQIIITFNENFTTVVQKCIMESQKYL